MGPCGSKNKPVQANTEVYQRLNQQQSSAEPIQQKNVKIEIDIPQQQPLIQGGEQSGQFQPQTNGGGGQTGIGNEGNKEQTQTKPDQLDEDLYINDIMKQFDELNQLFNQMAQEFDSISQYLLSVSGNQGVPP